MTPPVCLRVAVLWHDTLIAEATVDARRPVTVGEDPRNTLIVPDVAGVGARHLLFDAGSRAAGATGSAGDDTSVRLHLTAAMRVRLARDGGALDVITAAPDGIPISDRDWGLVELAPRLSIFFQAVDAPDRVPPAAPWGAMEAPVLGALLGALTLHLAVLIAAFLLWDPGLALASFDMADRPPIFSMTPPPPPVEPVAEAEEPVAEVAKAAGAEAGVFGERDKTAPSAVPKREGELVDRIKETGVHRALGSDLLGRGPLQHVFGDKTGFDSKLSGAMAGAGDGIVVGAGTGGLGLRGTGTGGGADGFGRVQGMGRLDTGNGGGPRAALGGRQKRAATARVRVGDAGLTGFCKEADITRVVTARQRGITYCYEKALARDPGLQGKVTVSWRILLDGNVGAVMLEGSTLGDRAVDDCITRQVRRWRFPRPEGGMCQVRFPFVFNAGL